MNISDIISEVKSLIESSNFSSSVNVFVNEVLLHVDKIPPAKIRKYKPRPIPTTDSFKSKLELLKDQMSHKLYELLSDLIQMIVELQSS